MKIKYIFTSFILITCSLKAKNSKVAVYHIQETIENLVEDAKSASPKEKRNTNFGDVIKNIKEKPLPLTENTNFDDFIEAEDYKEVDVKSLKLLEIYPNFHKEGYGFRAIRCYKIAFSKAFYSVVVTLLKGDNEMESVLINYGLNGNIVDSKVISYDEIAESVFKIESRIEQNKLTISNIADMEERSEDITVFTINTKGKINATQTNEFVEGINPIEEVILQLNLNCLKINTDLIVSKVMPNNPDETILVIPEIVDEGEHYFELNSHILIIDSKTGTIKNRYFESSQTNGWISDAIQLKEIKIDTAPYMVTDDVRAFGIRVYYYGSSRANPYTNETLSLYTKKRKSLKKILNNYQVMHYGGEWDTDCVGEFQKQEKVLILTENKTDRYYDILVKTKVTETKNFEDENGDCDAKEEISRVKTLLTFDETEYKTIQNSKGK